MLKLKFEDSFQETDIGNIPSGWDVKQLGSALKIKYGKGLPERDRRSGNIPVFGSSGIVGFHDRALCKGPGLIIGRKGNIGSVYFSKSDFYPIDTVFYCEDIENAAYLYFTLTNIDLEQLMSDSAVPGLNIHFLESVKVPYPSQPEQNRIGTVLSWFDDLIENKKRQNEILEKVALAIFKSWFIDFEPFKDGEFVPSELGDIPKDWKVGRLTGISEIIMGQSPPSKYYNEDGKGLPFIQGKGQFGKYTPETTIYCSSEGKNAKPRDILVTVRAPVGELNIADRDYMIGRGLASLRSKYWSFVFSWLRQNTELLKALERGTTFEAITKQELENFPILLPPTSILEKFNSIIDPLFQKILLNQKQIMILRKVRDTLLPLLIFGKLRVEEI
jgi:type I restriction enzyme S subunit